MKYSLLLTRIFISRFYNLTNITFVGGSLIKHGGQNPLEATRFGCNILHGPNVDNFKEIFKFLNLDWSNKAKDFYKTAKDRIDISTPSYNQVTSPLYLKSINRWKNYEENFIEVKNDLQKWTHEFEYKV